jgi:hypothetical protein
VHNLEYFDFFDSEIPQTRENDVRVQSGVVGVEAKATVIPGVCVTLILESNTIATAKDWTAWPMTFECGMLLFVL